MRSKKHLAVGLAAVCGLASAASADPANIGKVIITEIFANPNDNDGSGFGIRSAGDNLEFIEIFNTTNAPIDISGWRLDDEDPTASAPFPAGTILGARQALVIIGAQLGLAPNDPAVADGYLPETAIWTKALFNQAFGRTVGTPGELNVLVLPGNITIANTPTLSNEVPFIVDQDGTVIDTVTYGQPDFPAVTAGQSLVLRPQFLNATDNDRSCAWALASVDPGSLTSVDTVFSYTPSGGTTPTTRDRLADAGNIASPGSVGNFGSTLDENNNGIPDFQEICGGASPLPDCNGNLRLDAFEPDVNNNGIPDECEVVNDREIRDTNMNNIPDDVDVTLAGGVNGVGGPLDLNSDGRLDGSEINGRVIITEIMVDPTSSVTSGGSLEWVEVQNVSSTPTDIGGYRLADLETGGDGYTAPVPAGTVLQPGEVAVLCAQPTTLTSATAAADAVTVYRALWGATTPAGTPIRWIPLARWGARATNATARAEILALIGNAAVNDAIVPANQSTTSGPHPTRLTNGAQTNPVTWVTSRGFIVDVANYSNTNSNGDPLNGWPGSDGVSSFFLVPTGSNYSLLGNNAGRNWRLSIAGLNGAVQAAGIADAALRPFALVNTGKDVGSPGYVPTSFQQPSGDVIITEIGATTNSIWPGSSRTPPTGQTVAGGQDEFVEILNRTSSPIDLTGWYLQDEDGRTQPFPAGTVLQANQAAVIIGGDTAAPTGTNQPGLQPLTGRDFRQEFYNAWGCGYPVIVTTNWYTTSANSQFGLGRLADGPSYTNEILRIVRPDGTPTDVVNYDDDGLPTAIAIDPFGWPADASTGILTFWSIYTLPGTYTQADNDIGLNWAASLTGFDGGRQSVVNTALDASNNPTGIFNASMFGSPGFVAGVTGNVTDPGPACVPCRADFNNSGTRDVADIFAFLSAWFANGPGSDFNNSGTRDVADIFAFLSAWFAGCP